MDMFNGMALKKKKKKFNVTLNYYLKKYVYDHELVESSDHLPFYQSLRHS